MLVLSSLSVWSLRESTHRLAFESQPKVEALDQINQGLSQTQLTLQHYLADGIKSRKRTRAQTWRVDIVPAFEQLRSLASSDGRETRASLKRLKRLLLRTEALQGEIQNLSHQPENLPSKMGYELHARPIYQHLKAESLQLVQQLKGRKNAETRWHLIAFLDSVEISHLQIQLLLDYGVEGRLEQLVEAFHKSKTLLSKTKTLIRGAGVAKVALLEEELAEFQEVTLIVAEERRNKTWNQTLYLQEYQLNPLRDQLGTLLGSLDREMVNAIRSDATQAAFVATTSLILALILIVVLLGAAVLISIRRSTALTKPIAQLAQASDAFAAGTLGADLPVQSRDELGDLTVTFNRMKNSLLESYGRYRAIVDNVADGIITIDQRGRIHSYNKAAEQIFGFFQEEVVGKSLFMLMPTEFTVQYGGFLNEYLKTGSKRLIGQGIETRIRHKNGGLRPVYLALSETRYGGQLLFTGLVRDIRNQKALEHSLIQAKEEALNANQLKSRFLANISHEVRTPMNGILGMTELALETDLSANQRRYLLAANGGAKALLKLLNDVLDLSKMEGAHVELEVIDFNLENLLEDTMEGLSIDAQKKGLDFILNIGSDVPTFVAGDPTRVRQIFVNLIGNAIKFTKKGQVLLKANIQRQQDDCLVLDFSIEDTGIGIPADRLENVFDSFTQSDGSTSRNYGGTGLGTTIAKQLIEMMGGEIGITSEVGQGTEVSFSLNFKPALVKDQITPTSIMDITLKEVLVVDDNRTNLSNFNDILRSWKLSPTLSDSAQGALEEVQRRETPFDLLIVDVQMPIMDGFELASLIRQEPGYQEVPVVFLFSFITPQHQASLAEMGEPLYLFKPVKREELKERILEAESRLNPNAALERVISEGAKVRNFARQYKVLVIEDDPTSALLLETRLEAQNLQVFLADTAAKAMKAFEARSYDLILTDFRLPDGNAVELSQKFRQYETNRQLRLTPIFVLTGEDPNSIKNDLRRAQVFQIFTKPIDFQLLFIGINQLFGQEIDPNRKVVEPIFKQLSVAQAQGFDLVKGLVRWGDSQAAYLGAIQTFCQGYQWTVLELADYRKQNKLGKINELAHRIKGSAGNIGANDLFESAKKVGMMIEKGEVEGLEAEFKQLEETLGSAIRSGIKLVKEFRSEPSRPKSSSRDLKKVISLLDELIPVIERGEAVKAEALVAQALDQVGDHDALGLIQQLAREVDGFDFEKALRTTEQATESLSSES